MKGNKVNTSFLNRLKNLDATSWIIIATFLIACFMPFASFEKGRYLKTVTCFTSLFYEESSLFGMILLTLPIIALFVNINMPGNFNINVSRNTGVTVLAAFMAFFSFSAITMEDHNHMSGLGGNIIYGVFSLLIIASCFVKKDFLKTLTLCTLALSYFITWFYMDFSNIGSGQKLIKYSHNGEFWMFMFSLCPFIMIFFSFITARSKKGEFISSLILLIPWVCFLFSGLLFSKVFDLSRGAFWNFIFTLAAIIYTWYPLYKKMNRTDPPKKSLESSDQNPEGTSA